MRWYVVYFIRWLHSKYWKNRKRTSKDWNNWYPINQDGYINSLYWLKVKHPSANKGDAITFIKNHVACDYTVSFGNETNDIEMFLASDISICVVNAYNVIKDIADYRKISITIADDILELFEKEYHRYSENNKQV